VLDAYYTCGLTDVCAMSRTVELQVRADEVYGLENRKFQMQMGLEERKHETEVHAEILRASLKTAQEDMHRATLEVKERQLRTTRLQSKYEVMVGKRNMGGGDGDDGDHSQAYFVIKAAQVRFWSRSRRSAGASARVLWLIASLVSIRSESCFSARVTS